MRHGSNSRRSRGRNGNGRRGGGNAKTQTYDSNGPDVRIRGNAFQITEKYMTLARDAASAGDTILAESYYQHAEHYQRIINEFSNSNEQQGGQKDKNTEAKGGNQKSDDSQGNQADEQQTEGKKPRRASSRGKTVKGREDEAGSDKAEKAEKPKRAPRKKADDAKADAKTDEKVDA